MSLFAKMLLDNTTKHLQKIESIYGKAFMADYEKFNESISSIKQPIDAQILTNARKDDNKWPQQNIRTLSNHILLQEKQAIRKLIMDKSSQNIPSLKHNLHYLMKESGIFPLQALITLNDGHIDPIFNNLPPLSKYNTRYLDTYVKPSNHVELMSLANKHGLKYISSSSNISSSLAHVIYMIMNFKTPNYQGISEVYSKEPMKYMISQRKPSLVNLVKKGGVFIFEQIKINTDVGKLAVLLEGGKLHEKLFNNEIEHFKKKYLKDENGMDNTKFLQDADIYRFTAFGDILVRSQLDCIDPVTNEIFEIKTRAVAPIRYDIDNYEQYLDYTLITDLGLCSSYEREYYDLIRGGFLKYILQIMIGNMSSAFVAHHNTKEIFGFSTYKLEDMQSRIFGGKAVAEKLFNYSMSAMNNILNTIVKDLNIVKDGNYLLSYYANDSDHCLDVICAVPESEGETADLSIISCTGILNTLKENNFTKNIYLYKVSFMQVINGVQCEFDPLLLNKDDKFELYYSISRHRKVDHTELLLLISESIFMTNSIPNKYFGMWKYS